MADNRFVVVAQAAGQEEAVPCTVMRNRLVPEAVVPYIERHSRFEVDAERQPAAAATAGIAADFVPLSW